MGKLISKILHWYDSIINGKIWLKVRVIFLIICVLGVIIIPVAWSQSYLALKKPLPMDYAMSWVILSLVSMVTLAYVPLINNLTEILRTKKASLSYDSRTKAKWRLNLLVGTELVLFLTILALTFRIVLLSFYPEAAEVVRQVAEGKSLEQTMPTVIQGVICLDYLAISSFIMGFIMRFWIFADSYLEKLVGYIIKELGLENIGKYIKEQYWHYYFYDYYCYCGG
jgi:hypothetical protein